MTDLLRIGVVGAGHFGRFHALKIAASARATLAGVHDLDGERAARVGAEAGGAPALGLGELLTASDAVVVAAPADAHFDIAERALLAGRHVLVEKPLAATLAQADRLAALARGAGLVLQVGHLLRYSAEHEAIAARITRPLYIEATRIAPFKPRGTDVSVILDLMIMTSIWCCRWWIAKSRAWMRWGGGFEPVRGYRQRAGAVRQRVRGDDYREPDFAEDRAENAAVFPRRAIVPRISWRAS